MFIFITGHNFGLLFNRCVVLFNNFIRTLYIHPLLIIRKTIMFQKFTYILIFNFLLLNCIIRVISYLKLFFLGSSNQSEIEKQTEMEKMTYLDRKGNNQFFIPKVIKFVKQSSIYRTIEIKIYKLVLLIFSHYS